MLYASIIAMRQILLFHFSSSFQFPVGFILKETVLEARSVLYLVIFNMNQDPCISHKCVDILLCENTDLDLFRYIFNETV